VNTRVEISAAHSASGLPASQFHVPGSGSQNRCVRHRAMRRNHVWSYDFVAERTEDGRALRMLVVIDEFTRECLAIEVGAELHVG